MIFALYEQIKAEHPDIEEWETESIAMEFGEEFVDYVAVCNLLFFTDLPWENWRAFEKVAVVLNNRPVIGDIIQDLDSKEIAYAIHIMKKYFPEEKFNDDVCSFIVAELLDDGVVVCPPTLEFLQEHMPKVFLNKDQETMQLAYMDQIETYIKILDKEMGES